jgi:methyl-accepting chemotaxis protein
MTKEYKDLLMEQMYGSDNIARICRTVYIPKKIGRKNPDLIKTDSFDFAKIVDGISRASDTIGKVSDTVNTVSNTVKSVSTTVKNVASTAQDVRGTVNSIRSNASSLANNVFLKSVPQRTYIPEQYSQPQQLQSNVGILPPNMMLIGGVLILVVVFMFKK